MEKENSRKIVIKVSVVCLILAVAASVALFSLVYRQEESRSTAISFTQEVKVTDGVAEPQVREWELPVTQEGRYCFYAGWQAVQPSFVTGCVIKDEGGQVLFAVTGDFVAVESVELELDAQTYRVEMHYLTNEEDYIRFVGDYIVGEHMGKDVEISPFGLENAGTDGVWTVDHTVEARGISNWYAIGAGAGVMIAVVLVVLILALTKNGRSAKCQFDERQELVRGRGAKYAFYTLLICNAVVGALEIAEFPRFADTDVLMIINCLMGICVYVVYCIWYDGYFALNENRKRLMIAFAVIGISNFLLSAVGFASGGMVQDGRLTFRSLNLFCGILFIVIFTTMYLKKVFKDGKEEQL